LVVIVALVLVPGAWARTCRFDAATRTVYAPPGVTTAYDRLWVEDGRIMWNDLATTAPCGAATVTNTDTIRIKPPLVGLFSEVVIDEHGGPFAPGATPEAMGESEIEILVSNRFLRGVDDVVGTPGSDTIAIGDRGIALNNDGDLDVRFGAPLSPGGTIRVDGGAGDDFLSGQGGFGAGAPVAAPLVLLGGDSVNELVGGTGPDDLNDFYPRASGGKLRGMQGDDRLEGSDRG